MVVDQFTIKCKRLSDLYSILFQDGCWCCLDEAQVLGRVVMSVMLEHLEAVANAMKARQGFVTFRDGQEVGSISH